MVISDGYAFPSELLDPPIDWDSIAVVVREADIERIEDLLRAMPAEELVQRHVRAVETYRRLKEANMIGTVSGGLGVIARRIKHALSSRRRQRPVSAPL